MNLPTFSTTPFIGVFIMALTPQERTGLIKLAVGMFNAAPGATYFSELAAVYEGAAGRSLSTVASILSNSTAFLSANPPSQLPVDFARSFLMPLGLDTNVEAVDFMVARLNTGANKGALIVQALNAIDGSSSPVFANAKAILNNKTLVAENYTLTLARTETNLVALKAAIATVTADASSVFAANAANAAIGAPIPPVVFNIMGTAGDDTLAAALIGDNVQALAGEDTVSVAGGGVAFTGTFDGGLGTDTLKLNSGSNISGVTVSNFEILSLTGPVTMTAAQYAAFNPLLGVFAPVIADNVTLTTAGSITTTSLTGDLGVQGYFTSAAGNTVTTGGPADGSRFVFGSTGPDTLNTTVANGVFMNYGAGAGADVLNITGGITANIGITTGAPSASTIRVTGVETLNISGASTANTLSINNANADELTTVNASGVTGGGINLDLGFLTGPTARTITLTSGNDTILSGINKGNAPMTVDFGTGNATVNSLLANGTGALTLKVANSTASTTSVTFAATPADLKTGDVLDFNLDVSSIKVGAGNAPNQFVVLGGASAGLTAADTVFMFDVNGDGNFSLGDIQITLTGQVVGVAALSIVAGNIVLL